MTEKKMRKIKLDIMMMILTVVGLTLFLVSYTTKYYVFGQMHSVAILISLAGALAVEVIGLCARERYPQKEWPHILVVIMIVLLCCGIGLILMDRVEAVGNCVVTNFDEGHGGEEAVYISFAAILAIMAAVILGIVKNFLGRSSIKVVEVDVD